MTVYFFTFLSSIILFALSVKFNNKKKIRILFSSIAIIIPCIVAAMRGINIGTDTSGYQYSFYIYATRSKNLLEMFKWVGSHEYLYLTTTYISTLMFHKFSFVLFFNQLLVILPIYYGLKSLSNDDNNYSIVFGMFIYYMFFYNLSLNMARQSIALAFYIYAFSMIEKEKYFRFVIFSLLACLFHNSAIIFIPILLIYRLLKNKKYSTLIYCISLLIILLCIIFAKDIFKLLNLYSITKYSYIISEYQGEIGISKLTITLWLFPLFITIRYKEKIKNITSNYLFYRMSVIVTILSSYITTIITHSDRLFYYFSFPFIFIILSRFPYEFEKKKKRELLFILIVLFILYWLYTIVIKNYNMTYPYQFMN